MCHRITVPHSTSERETLKGANKKQSVLDKMTKRRERKISYLEGFNTWLQITFKMRLTKTNLLDESSYFSCCQQLENSHRRGFMDFFRKGSNDLLAEFWITTPIPASSLSLNIAPSKFFLNSPSLGGTQTFLLPN